VRIGGQRIKLGPVMALSSSGMWAGVPLGRLPTVLPHQPRRAARAEPRQSIETCPLVSAVEETIYSVLKNLLSNEAPRDRRKQHLRLK
jgi:hypothetical protein